MARSAIKCCGAIAATLLGVAVARDSMAAPGGPLVPKDESAGTANKTTTVRYNALYFDVGGQGIGYSINYERQLENKIAFRIGVAELSPLLGGEHYGSSDTTAYSSGIFIALPMTVGYLGLGSRTNMLETTVGVTMLYLGEGNTWLGHDTDMGESLVLALPTASVGYRFTSRKGFLFRVGGEVIVTPGGKVPVLPWPYLSFGGVFH